MPAKHFNQQASGVVQTCLYRLRCECKQLGSLLRRHAVDNAGHEHDAQLIGQLIYRPFQDVSDHTVGRFTISTTLARNSSVISVSTLMTRETARLHGCPYRKLDPAILIMKAGEDRSHGDLAEPLNRTTERCVFGEGEMRPNVIVIDGVDSKNSAQMSFAEHDDVIEAFPADRADQPLRMPVLPW